jgi:phosphate transport system substrate-binding protein
LNTGLCTNLPSQCSKAAAREAIPMPSPDSTCPECGSRLQAVRNGGRKPLPLGLLLGGGAAALAAAVVVWLAMSPSAKVASRATVRPATVAAAPQAVAERLLTLAGSNTIGSSLAPELVKAWLGSKHATEMREEEVFKDGVPLPERRVTAMLDGKLVEVDVRAHGSSTAFTDLEAGTTDVGMSSRPIKDAEVTALARLGDMRRPSSEHVLALDGVAVIVPTGNTIAKLSMADLGRIFSGEAKTWSSFGGSSHPIKLYARDDRSGTYDTFKELVLRGAPLAASIRFEDSAELEAAVSRDPDGIGFVGLPYIKTTRPVAVSDGAAAALEPTRFSVKTESYPLSRRLFLYTAANPANPATGDFVGFALSSAGQAVVRSERFVDLDLTGRSQPEPQRQSSACRLSPHWTGDAQAYCHLRDGAEQLGTSFRFRPGSAELDTRATQDLRRVLERMEQSPDKAIVLAGFADSSGSYASNCALSRTRSKSVATALETLGLKVTETVGYCDELPVRDNASLDGRELNRRVELFLR